MEKNKHMGFPLPHEFMQNEYEKLMSEIKQKFISWDDLFEGSSKGFDDVREMFNKETSSAKPDLQFASILNAVMNIRLVGMLTCKLGMELTETRERLAGIEKELKALKPRAK